MSFETPNRQSLKLLQDWLEKKDGGNFKLEGLDRNVWEEGNDLLAIHPESFDDSFTRLIHKRVISFYHKYIGLKFQAPTDIENGLYKYEPGGILRAADIVGTLISSSLPILAVVVLCCVKSLLTRLGLVGLFTVLFSLALITITEAKRVEIFAATAA